jgi:hypothetical protein
VVRPHLKKSHFPREKKHPPCATCRPRLDPANRLAVEVYGRCSDEWLTAGMSGVRLAISGPSIEAALNASQICDLDDRSIIFDQVKTISRVIVAELNAEAAKKQDANPQ